MQSVFLFGKWNGFQGKITQSCTLEPSPNGHIISYCSVLSSRPGRERVSRSLAEFSALFGHSDVEGKHLQKTRDSGEVRFRYFVILRFNPFTPKF